MLQAQYGQLASVENMRLYSGTLYEEFTTKVVENGTIMWRTHTPENDIFVLNDYDVQGELLPTKFVHIEQKRINDEMVYICDCSTYLIIQCSLLSAVHLESEEQVLPAGTVCMHCRFMKEHMAPALEHVHHTPTGDNDDKIQRRVRKAERYRDQGVVALLESDPTSKYSARSRSDGNCSVVHITANTLSCQQGECQAKLHSKRSSKNLLLDDAAKVGILCPHLDAMRAQKEVWLSDDQEVQDSDNPEPQNTEDTGLLQAEVMRTEHEYLFHPKWMIFK
jgi:hypothetical protein